jgi:hypothetical protein
MFKKLSLLALSVAALVAFAVPAVAQGNAIITTEGGGAATAITAVSENTVSVTAAGTLSCSTVHLEGNLSTNNTTEATATGSGSAIGSPFFTPHHGPCEIEGVAPVVNITSIDLKHLVLDGGGTGTAEFLYKYTTPAGVCHFEGHADVTYAATTDMINIDGTLVGSATEGNCSTFGVISGDFKVTDGSGNPVVIH